MLHVVLAECLGSTEGQAVAEGCSRARLDMMHIFPAVYVCWCLGVSVHG